MNSYIYITRKQNIDFPFNDFSLDAVPRQQQWFVSRNNPNVCFFLCCHSSLASVNPLWRSGNVIIVWIHKHMWQEKKYCISFNDFSLNVVPNQKQWFFWQINLNVYFFLWWRSSLASAILLQKSSDVIIVRIHTYTWQENKRISFHRIALAKLEQQQRKKQTFGFFRR